MESRSYMFSTARKRSTLLENKGIEYLLVWCRFPRDDKNAPRMRIVRKECPDDYEKFMSCLENNPGKPENCLSLRDAMFECGKSGFKKANTDMDYTYWSEPQISIPLTAHHLHSISIYSYRHSIRVVLSMINDMQSTINFLFVFLGCQSVLGFLVVLDFEEPGVFGLIVDEGGIFLNLAIDCHNLSCNGTVDISCQFDTLDHQGALSNLHLFANGREFNMNDLSELLLGIVSDANFSSTIFSGDIDPLVGFSVDLSWVRTGIHPKNLRRVSMDRNITNQQ